MSQGSSQMSSGNITPKVTGPEKGTKEVMVLGGVVLLLGGLVAAGWLYSQTGNHDKIPGNIEQANVTDLLKKTSVINQAEASTTPFSQVTAPVVSIPDIIHSDIYFEVGRKGLTDEGKSQLSAQAAMLKQNEEYGVLIQGYTDQQGSASYNKQLGMKRAETVKTELINAGIAEPRIKAMSLGEEGVLCIDNSDMCRHMNRRVHIEVRKIGQEHMMVPPFSTPLSESLDSTSDLSSTIGDGGSTTGDVPPAQPEPIPTQEPTSGS